MAGQQKQQQLQLQQQQQQQQQLGSCTAADIRRLLHRAVCTVKEKQNDEESKKIDYELMERRWSSFLSSVEKHGKMTTANFIKVYTDGPLNGGTGRFRDLHLRLRGAAAAELGFVFLHSLQAAKADSIAHKTLQQLQQIPPLWCCGCVSSPNEEGSLVQVLESDVPKKRRCIQEVLRQAIQTVRNM
ncbi:cardiolipin synthase, putative [Eimeria maxima]|uniref:Cardiolipin synthase, putative n=1 Tax=Eimeria maxima TaxID=5804 RepID=U6M6A2_EIMMA|nr:cardiolipin synthase, putative [Eimeria maxima]CDJ58583.1 cardiolipin synthase, putative [Eimeria maxima]